MDISKINLCKNFHQSIPCKGCENFVCTICDIVFYYENNIFNKQNYREFGWSTQDDMDIGGTDGGGSIYCCFDCAILCNQ